MSFSLLPREIQFYIHTLHSNLGAVRQLNRQSRIIADERIKQINDQILKERKDFKDLVGTTQIRRFCFLFNQFNFKDHMEAHRVEKSDSDRQIEECISLYPDYLLQEKERRNLDSIMCAQEIIAIFSLKFPKKEKGKDYRQAIWNVLYEFNQKQPITKLQLDQKKIGFHLYTLPSEIGMLTSLQVLDLNRNRLKTLPAEIGHLTELKILTLWRNNLESLPNLGKLSKLQVLNLSNNRLKDLPQEIGQLTDLEQLDIEGNQLTDLPKEMGQLSKLKSINLYRNKIKKISEEIIILPSLEKIFVDKMTIISLYEYQQNKDLQIYCDTG